MGYSVYVLKSEIYGTRYVGSTENVDRRLRQHNQGRCRYTKGRRPWKLVYQEQYEILSEARVRERFLKSGKGRQELDQILA